MCYILITETGVVAVAAVVVEAVVAVVAVVAVSAAAVVVVVAVVIVVVVVAVVVLVVAAEVVAAAAEVVVVVAAAAVAVTAVPNFRCFSFSRFSSSAAESAKNQDQYRLSRSTRDGASLAGPYTRQFRLATKEVEGDAYRRDRSASYRFRKGEGTCGSDVLDRAFPAESLGLLRRNIADGKLGTERARVTFFCFFVFVSQPRFRFSSKYFIVRCSHNN